MSKMPILPVDAMCKDLSDYEEELIRAAFNRTTGKLRATKPFRKVDKTAPFAFFGGEANYVWRMLCFDFCAFSPHSCMPVTADFDIPGSYDKRREVAKVLDALIKRAESVAPIVIQAGAMRFLGLV